MDTLRLAFTQIIRERGAPGCRLEIPQLLGQDLLHHAESEVGLRELVEFAGAAIGSSVDEVVREILDGVALGQLGFQSTSHTAGLGLACEALPEPIDLAEWAEADELVVEHALVIELLGEDDGPVAGLKYQVVLPNGTIREGALDQNGRARISGLADPEACEVLFPTLDTDAWDYERAVPL